MTKHERVFLLTRYKSYGTVKTTKDIIFHLSKMVMKVNANTAEN